jgi:hypothetical protein
MSHGVPSVHLVMSSSSRSGGLGLNSGPGDSLSSLRLSVHGFLSPLRQMLR